MVRLDRPNETILSKYVADVWKREDIRAPFSRHQVTRVAFEADKALAFALGDHQDSKADWMMLSEDARLKLIQGGPPAGRHPLRYALWDVVTGLLVEHSR